MKVAIIGAGIAGASVAYHLRAAGADVVVVDQAHAGKATLAGAGIVCPWATATEDPAFFDLYAAGAAYYGRLIPELESCGEDRVGYGRVGALVVGEDPDELTEIRLLHVVSPIDGAAFERYAPRRN